MKAAAEPASESAETAHRVVIQRNPASGSGRGAAQLLKLIEELRNAGYQVRLFASRERFDHFLSNPQIRRNIACLVAAGGDGTVASVVSRHAEFPIATLPLGTENLVARYLGIPSCGKTVARMIQRNMTRQFDTGLVNGQRFLLMTSAGVDAAVVHHLSSRRSGNIRRTSYLRPILSCFHRYRFPQIKVLDSHGRLIAKGSHVIATNIPAYGFRMPFCPAADPHDGQLDVRVFRTAGAIATIRHAIRTRLGWADKPGDLMRFRATQIELHSEAGDVPLQYDGDPTGVCPAIIRVDPASMTLLVME